MLKDFVTIAGPLNVSHLLIFSRSEAAIQLRIVRLPRGPTMTFRINSYSLGRDVVSSLRRNHATQSQYLNHPLLVMNHFSGDGMQMKLMATMFQNMFPSINVNKVGICSLCLPGLIGRSAYLVNVLVPNACSLRNVQQCTIANFSHASTDSKQLSD